MKVGAKVKVYCQGRRLTLSIGVGPYKRGPLYVINKKVIFLYAIYYRLLKTSYAINTFLICNKQENKEDYMPKTQK